MIADSGKKKILLLKGKEREIPSVSSQFFQLPNLVVSIISEPFLLFNTLLHGHYLPFYHSIYHFGYAVIDFFYFPRLLKVCYHRGV